LLVKTSEALGNMQHCCMAIMRPARPLRGPFLDYSRSTAQRTFPWLSFQPRKSAAKIPTHTNPFTMRHAAARAPPKGKVSTSHNRP
jgi:hypothetical protein